jgi:hypothetical protein
MDRDPETSLQVSPLLRTKRCCGSAQTALVALLLALASCHAGCENGHPESPAGKPASSPRPLPRAAPSVAPAGARTTAGHTVDAYALGQPARVVKLPDRLREISGITDISDHELGCVQDEDGIVFIYNLQLGKITRELRFGPPGDYEGLSRAGDKLYVLRSDGLLYEVTLSAGGPNTRTHLLRVPTKNNEGLGFDARRNRLLIAPKSRLGKGRAYKDTRAIFAYDLKTKTRLADPVLELSVDAIRQFAEKKGQPLPQKRKKKGRGGTRVALRFMPSSIAVHPVTRELFVLSAIDYVLAVFDQRGTVTGYARLNPSLFRQPEGITFLPNGDMVISNEAAGERATLLLFKWQRKRRERPLGFERTTVPAAVRSGSSAGPTLAYYGCAWLKDGS